VTAAFALVPATLFVALLFLRGRISQSYTEALVWVFVASFVGVTVTTELLSVMGWLNPSSLTLVWLVALVVLLLLMVGLRVKPVRPQIKANQWGALVVVAVFFGIELFNALAARPTGADGSTYRLPRVMQWLQNDRVEVFPTIVERQVYIPPAADFWFLHTLGISRNDLWVNFPQLFAGLVVVFSAAAIGGWLARSNKAWSLAAIFAVTTPILLSQMISVQSDLLSAALVLSALFVATVGAEARPLLSTAALAAISSIAIGAKVTGFVLIIPILIYFLWIQRARFRSVLVTLIAFGSATALVTVVPHLIRLSKVYGSPFMQTDNYFNIPPSLVAAFLNIPRVVVSLGSLPSQWFSSQGSRVFNSMSDAILGQGSEAIGVWGETTFQVAPWFTEDYVSAPVQIFLTLIFVTLVIVRREKVFLWLALLVVAQVALLGAMVLWQPWINRFSFPIAIIGSLGAAGYLAHRHWLIRGLLVILSIAVAVPLLLYPKGREWLPSPGFPALGLSTFDARITPWERAYFAPGSSEALAVERVAEIEPNLVRLYLPGFGKDGEGSVEYPWWPALREYLPDVRIEHARSIPPMPPVPKPTEKYVTICVEVCPVAPGETAEQIGDLTVVSGEVD
jgi:hypothetical protein